MTGDTRDPGRVRLCAVAEADDLARIVALTDPRQIIVAVLRRMKTAGESHEMAARWILEELHKHGFEVINNG